MARQRPYVAPTSAPMGRTDQGVDWATKPGDAIGAIGAGIVDFVGRFSGFGNYIAYHLTSGPNKGDEIYAAEFGAPVVRVGQRVRRGQTLGYEASGTPSGIEVGFAQSGGSFLPLAQSEGGYTEGQATEAGQRFRALIGGSPSVTLETLWTNAGGPANVARIMAAIALAESGGQINASHSNADGSTDRGLWQINSSHAAYDPGRLLSDPNYNATAAVAVYRSQGLGAWTTYKSGAYRSYLDRAPTAGVVGGVAPGTQPRSRPDGSGDDPAAQLAAWQDYLNPTTPFGPLGAALGEKPLIPFGAAGSLIGGVGDFFKWTAWLLSPIHFLRVVELTAGLGLMAFGIWTSVKTFESSSSSEPTTPKPARVVTRAVRLSPAGRALSVRSAERSGRRQAKEQRHLAERDKARKRARKTEETRSSNRRFEREARRGPSSDIPF